MYRRFIGRLLVVMMWWVFSSFSKCPGFLIWDIFLDVLLLYDKKEKLDTYNPYIKLADKRTTTNEWSELQEKKQPMDYDNVNRWYNIGIYPIWDYINHGTTTIYQSFQCIYDNNTWTSNTSSYMNESETIHECNTWKERPYIKQPMDYTNTGLYSIIYSIIPYRDYI